MNSLSNYVFEAMKTHDAEVPTKVYKICDELIRHINYSQLKETDDQDPDKFDISEENEQVFIDSFANANIEYTALSTQDYYALTNSNDKWENLSTKEKADFNTQNGDIIIVDENNKPLYFICIKISSDTVGAVSLGSLANFNENGYYICIDKTNKTAKFVSHKALVKAVKDNQNKFLKPVIKGRKEGYPVKWEGQNLTSEYFVPGKEIMKFN